MSIEIKVDTTAAREKLERLGRALNPRTVLKLIGQRLKGFVDHQFNSAGEGRWTPLAASTIANRKRGGSAPLQDTGRLRQSYVETSDGATFVRIGSNDARAAMHEYGTRPHVIRARNGRALAFKTSQGAITFRKAVNHPGIPARPVLPNKAVAERLIQEELDSYLEEAAK